MTAAAKSFLLPEEDPELRAGPQGVQLLAPALGEATMFRAAAVLEGAMA